MIGSLPSKEKLEKAWRILEEEVWSEKESVWEKNSRRQIERDRRNERRIAKEEYINPSVMDGSWGIEKVSSNKELDSRTEAQSIHQVSRGQELSRSIHQVSRRHRDCIKKKAWEARQIARYSRGVKPAFQNSFLRCEKHRYECNPTYNLTNDSINTTISQNSLSIQKKFWAQGSPKHTYTHTLNKSNQFYISKISYDGLVSIH